MKKTPANWLEFAKKAPQVNDIDAIRQSGHRRPARRRQYMAVSGIESQSAQPRFY